LPALARMKQGEQAFDVLAAAALRLRSKSLKESAVGLLNTPHSGFGRQTSLAEVVELAAAEMEITHGRPQKLLADADGIQIEADRSRTDGPLDMYVVRLRAEGDLLEAVRKLAAKTPTLPLKETDGTCELRASGDPKTGASPRWRPSPIWSPCRSLARQRRGRAQSPAQCAGFVQRDARASSQRPASLSGATPVFRVDGEPWPRANSNRLPATRSYTTQELAPASDGKRLVATINAASTITSGLAFFACLRLSEDGRAAPHAAVFCRRPFRRSRICTSPGRPWSSWRPCTTAW